MSDQGDIFERLFQPLQLGGLTLPNRVVMTPVKLGYATKRGEVTDRHIAFYVRRAEGGAGLIITEPMVIWPNGREIPTQLGIYDDGLLPGLRRLTDAVHAAGGRIFAHINHAGRAANPKLVPEGDRVSAWAVRCPANGVLPRPLDREEIPTYVGYFAQAARRAKEAGFDGLEIPFSHGYLIHQFLSPLTNHRDDEYGGPLENRLRFGLEVLAAVREAVGADFPILVRMNALDHVPGGLTLWDAIPIAQALEAVGVDGLSVTSGTMCESVPFCLYPAGTPKAHLPPFSAQIRTVVSVPVGVAGRIRRPDWAEEVLERGQADFIGLGRPFLADPDWPRKAQAGDVEGIALCAACHQGCLAELRKGHTTSCLVNPLTGHEGEVRISPTDRPKQVLVVGGGVAGLEAAWVAAQRGHHVTLYEKSDRLGGQFHIASVPPHKEEFFDLIRFLETMVRRAGVEIHLNTLVTPEMVREMAPDVAVIATGGVPLIIHFLGLEEANWVSAHDLLDGRAEVTTNSALVIGGGLVGLETADFLAARGKRVTVVEMLDTIGGDMDPLARAVLTKRLQERAVMVYTGTKVVRVEKDRVIARRGDREVVFPVETIVMAVGARANREPADALQDAPFEVHVIGDAVRPRKALEAIQEGFKVGLEV